MIDEAVEVWMAMKFPEAFLGFNMTGIEFLLDFKSRIENFYFHQRMLTRQTQSEAENASRVNKVEIHLE
jgi:hypothetical protein